MYMLAFRYSWESYWSIWHHWTNNQPQHVTLITQKTAHHVNVFQQIEIITLSQNKPPTRQKLISSTVTSLKSCFSEISYTVSRSTQPLNACIHVFQPNYTATLAEKMLTPESYACLPMTAHSHIHFNDISPGKPGSAGSRLIFSVQSSLSWASWWTG